jgi:hypothetical protein
MLALVLILLWCLSFLSGFTLNVLLGGQRWVASWLRAIFFPTPTRADGLLHVNRTMIPLLGSNATGIDIPASHAANALVSRYTRSEHDTGRCSNCEDSASPCVGVNRGLVFLLQHRVKHVASSNAMLSNRVLVSGLRGGGGHVRLGDYAQATLYEAGTSKQTWAHASL